MAAQELTNAELLGAQSARNFPSYKSKSGLFGASNLDATLHIKRYAQRRMPTNLTERQLLGFEKQAPEDVIMSLIMAFAVIVDGLQFQDIAYTALAVHADPGTGLAARQISVATYKRPHETAWEGRRLDQLAYSNGLFLPAAVLTAAQTKDWDYSDSHAEPEEWSELVDLIHLVDSSRIGTID